jgi:two-component system response regulator AtoC
MTTAKRPLTVLVVDDEALIRWSIAELLRRGGHTVIEAMSAAQARDVMTHAPAPIGVVLLDHRLPDSDDFGLLEEVRRRLPRSTVMLMTAYATPEIVAGARNRGAYCVLSKPFDLYSLEGLIAEADGSSGYQ